MILFLLTLSLFFGLKIKFDIALYIIISILYLLFIAYRFRKLLIPCICFIFLGVIISFISFDWNTTVFSGVVTESKENYYLLNSKFEKLYVYEKNNDKEVGDLIRIKGYKKELSFQVIESGFDFKNYLNKKGIKYELISEKETIIFKNPFKIKKYKSFCLSKFSEENKLFVQTLMFSSGFDGELVSTLDDLYLNRLMSVSGLFIGFLFAFISRLINLIPKTKNLNKPLTILFTSLFSIFFYPKFAVARFLILEILKFINKKCLKEKLNYLSLLSISALCFIFYDYNLVYSDSFLLSYLIPIVVYLIRGAFNGYKSIYQKLLISLSIFILFIPFSLKFSNGFNLTSVIFQFIFSPIFCFIFLINTLSLIGIPLFNFSNFLYDVINKISKFIVSFKLEIAGPPFNNFGIFIYLLTFIVFFYYLSIKCKPIYKSILVLSIISLTLYFLPIKNTFTQEVTFINVGQGDACLIRDRHSTILIDTGGSLYNDIANDCLIPFFKKKRIYEIDAVVITHDDYDHNGALENLIRNFKVKNVLTNKDSFPIKLGDIYMQNLNYAEFEDKNESSLVLYFEMINQKFLIMGDAGVKAEKQILQNFPYLDCDIIKLGHHGSDTSSGKLFLKSVSPKEAIISVGKNYYGHPHNSVLKTLKELNIEIKRTDLLGSITYSNYIFM